MVRTHTLCGIIAISLVSGGLGWLAGQGATPAVGKEPRFPQLTMPQLTDAQRPLGEAIMKISAVGISGPYNPMLRSPVFGQRMFDLLDYLRWHSIAAAAAQRVRHSDHRAAVAFAGRVVCAPAACRQGRPVAPNHCGPEGQPAPRRHAGGRGDRL